MEQSLLKSLLSYDENTGVFTWIKDVNSRARKGEEAGWHTKRGYIRITIGKKRYPASRLAWLYFYGVHPTGEVDHINHIKSDNRISNLRCVSRSENSKNLPKTVRNKSGIVGVYWNKQQQKWIAELTLNHKKVFSKAFESKELAKEARKQAEISFNFHCNHGV